MDYLTDDHILASWRTFSLRTRVKLLETRFPDRQLSIKTLRMIYKKMKIKQRVVHVNYELTAAKLQQTDTDLRDRLPHLIRLIEQGSPNLIFIYEAVFSSKSMMQKNWAKAGPQLSITKK